MRRDMDLVRDMLMLAAECDGPLDCAALAGGARTLEVVAYHAEMLGEAGLARCAVRRDWDGGVVKATVGPLTWEGNDFLDAVASDGVWRKVKSTVAKVAGSAPFEVAKALAVRYATEALMG